MPVQIRSLTRHKNKNFCKASFPSTPSFDDFVYVCSRTQEDVVNINLTSVRLGWLTANGREIYWDLVSRNHSRLGRHHHQPHRNIGHQNHNWDYLLLALVTTILIIIFFNSIMLIFYDAFRNHDSDHLFSWGKKRLYTLTAHSEAQWLQSYSWRTGAASPVAGRSRLCCNCIMSICSKFQ